MAKVYKIKREQQNYFVVIKRLSGRNKKMVTMETKNFNRIPTSKEEWNAHYFLLCQIADFKLDVDNPYSRWYQFDVRKYLESQGIDMRKTQQNIDKQVLTKAYEYGKKANHNDCKDITLEEFISDWDPI
jgi:hypothetical protein